MQTKTFSVKDGTLAIVKDGSLIAYNTINGDAIIIASTYDYGDGTPILPSTLIRKQKTDEELAEGKSRCVGFKDADRSWWRQGFLAGRKSVGGEFHLTREQVEKLIWSIVETGYYKHISDESMSNLISSLTPPIYPTTITVENDGEKYYWETLKAEY